MSAQPSNDSDATASAATGQPKITSAYKPPEPHEFEDFNSFETAFTIERLRSDRFRVKLILTFFAICLLTFWSLALGAINASGRMAELIHSIVVPMSIVLLVGIIYETGGLFALSKMIRAGKALIPWKMRYLNSAAEVTLITALTLACQPVVAPTEIPHNTTTLLYFILILFSILQLDWRLSTYTGVIAAIQYAAMSWYVVPTEAIFAVTETYLPESRWEHLSTKTGLLVVAGGAAAFVAGQVRGFVASAVREGEIRRDKDRMERDLHIARQIQQNLLPDSMPDLSGFDLAAMSRPADQTGGDYYDWRYIGDQRAVITLADVTGHGVGPALVTAACRAYVRAIVTEHADPAAIIERVNRLLAEDLADGNFVTFAMLDLDAKTNTGYFLSAGHGPTFFIEGSSGEVSSISSQGFPLGVMDEQTLEEAVQFNFKPGDVVVLFSDGFFEWANEDGQLFGLDRLRKTVSDHRSESAQDLIKHMDRAISKFVGSRKQDDDMTAVAIKRVSV
jgi:serine phosphatase RsbU (regulator of sigma subunit)